jgi:microcystin degradation protein MlrC
MAGMAGMARIARARPLIAIGGFSIECNSFAPNSTSLEQLRSENFALGDEISRNSAGTSSELAGAWDVLAPLPLTLVPTALIAATPAPPVALDAFEFIKNEIVSRTPADVDGIYLMLHGSAYCREEIDPEGALLKALRKKVGPRPFIAISMDLHAHFTQEMHDAIDIAVAYRSCPHIDLYETGAQAARILHQAVIGEINPITHVERIPMVVPPAKHDNEFKPYGSLMNLCKEIERDGAYAASLLTVQPWLNVPDLGWKSLVVYEAEKFDGVSAAKKLAEEAWKIRELFMEETALPVAESLALAAQDSKLKVFADFGDATNGGSYGDSTELLRGLFESSHDLRAIFTITEPDAVAKLWGGVGATSKITLGTGEKSEYNESVECEVKVLAECDRKVVYTHPAAKDVTGSPGKSLLVEISHPVSKIFAVIHQNPVRVIDSSLYQLLGVNVLDYTLVQAKSHVSFKAGFAPLTENFILANTRGPTTADLLSLDFSLRTIPTYPFDI